jgi:hypothetical protein
MDSRQQAEPVTLSSVFRPVFSSLARLGRSLRRSGVDGRELTELRQLLETLPLSSEEFALACNRLRNAQRYLRAAERGASQWELNMLRQQLQRLQEQRPAPTHRRQRYTVEG